MRGIARDWGLVQAGLRSTQDAMAYLRGFDAGVPVPYSFGEPGIEGRPFYNAEFTALNFEVRRGPLTQVLEVPALRSRLTTAIGALGRPQMVLRVGWPVGPGSPPT